MGREQSEVDRPDPWVPGWGEQLEFSGARKGGEGGKGSGVPCNPALLDYPPDPLYLAESFPQALPGFWAGNTSLSTRGLRVWHFPQISPHHQGDWWKRRFCCLLLASKGAREEEEGQILSMQNEQAF